MQGVDPKLYYFGQQILLCSTKSQPQDCVCLLNLLFLMRRGLLGAFPATRQGVHPSVALEKSTLRRMILVQYSSCCRVFPEAVGISGLLDAIGLDAVEELVAIKEEKFITAGSDLDTTPSSFGFCILFARAVYQAEILGAPSGAEMADVEQMKKIIPFVTCEITFGQNVCELMFGINVSNLNLKPRFILSSNQSKATLWVLDTCIIVGLRPLIII